MFAPEILPSTLVGKFELESLLGTGGFGAAYRVRQIDLDRSVVLKILHAEVLEDPEAVSRFEAEARITTRLNHPNIVTVLDHGVGDGRPWILYELIEGETLAERLKAGPMGFTDVREMTGSMLSALEAAHHLGIVHRDLKTENVLRTPEGLYKLIDFGISKWSSRKGVRTAAGLIYGTPAYMAPELVRAGTVSPASDLYALGMVVYRCLAGRFPFDAGSPMDQVQANLRGGFPDVRTFRGETPEDLVRFVEGALAGEPAERFGSAAGARAILEAPPPPPRSRLEEPTREHVRSVRRRPREGADDPTRPVPLAPGAPRRGRRRRAFSRIVTLVSLIGLILGVGVWMKVGAPDPAIVLELRTERNDRSVLLDLAAAPTEDLEVHVSTGGPGRVVGRLEAGSTRFRVDGLEPDRDHLFAVRRSAGPQPVATAVVRTPALGWVERLNLYPADRWAIVDLMARGATSGALVVREGHHEHPPVVLRFDAGHARVNATGLEPNRDYQLDIRLDGLWGGVVGFPFRTGGETDEERDELSRLIGRPGAASTAAVVGGFAKGLRRSDPRLVSWMTQHLDLIIEHGFSDQVLRVISHFRDGRLFDALLEKAGAAGVDVTGPDWFTLAAVRSGRPPKIALKDRLDLVMDDELLAGVESTRDPSMMGLIGGTRKWSIAPWWLAASMVRLDPAMSRRRFLKWVDEEVAKDHVTWSLALGIHGLALHGRAEDEAFLIERARQIPEGHMRDVMVRGISLFDSPTSLEFLLEEFARTRFAHGTFQGLLRRGDASHVSRYLELVGDAAHFAADPGLQDLAFVGPGGFPGVALQQRRSLQIIGALGEPEPDAWGLLVALLENPDRDMRILATWALGRLAGRLRARTPARTVALDVSAAVAALVRGGERLGDAGRLTGIWALGEIGTPAARVELRRQLAGLTGGDGRLPALADLEAGMVVRSLGRAGDELSGSLLADLSKRTSSPFSREQIRRARAGFPLEPGIVRTLVFPYNYETAVGLTTAPERWVGIRVRGAWGFASTGVLQSPSELQRERIGEFDVPLCLSTTWGAQTVRHRDQTEKPDMDLPMLRVDPQDWRVTTYPLPYLLTPERSPGDFRGVAEVEFTPAPRPVDTHSSRSTP